MSTIYFIDTETTGLDPAWHRPWEVAMIGVDSATGRETSRNHWFVKLTNQEISSATPIALEINRFAERYDPKNCITRRQFAGEFLSLWRKGDHWAGACPWFDEGMLVALITDMVGMDGKPWHYHLIDIESMLYAAALEVESVELPWSVRKLTKVVNDNLLFEGDRIPTLSEENAHKAMDDAEQAAHVWRYMARSSFTSAPTESGGEPA